MIKEMSKKLTSVIVDEETSVIIDAETILLSIFTVLKDFAPTMEVEITHGLTSTENEDENRYDLIIDIENQKIILSDKKTQNKIYLNDILFFNYIKEEDYQENNGIERNIQ